ncbi:MAG: hypothetical protein HY369_04525 [Candidatus Aenigmarchaeota archaeon]|nr:hypothetical protein [Candidatus Aenigmarchaeota archaeon]
MSRSTPEPRRRGSIDLATFVIIAAIVMGSLFVLERITIIDAVIGIRTNVQLAVALNSEGTKVNTLTITDVGQGRYGELLAQGQADPALDDLLDELGLALVVRDGEHTIFSRGEVREKEGRFVDIALPGLRKGVLGVDAE